jgi:hypothetical protein
MSQFMNGAYDVTTQLFGPDSGIPWWAWLLVVVALMWKVVIRERQTGEDRDTAMVTAMTAGGDGKSAKKRNKKNK